MIGEFSNVEIIMLCIGVAGLAYAWTKMRGDNIRMEGV